MFPTLIRGALPLVTKRERKKSMRVIFANSSQANVRFLVSKFDVSKKR